MTQVCTYFKTKTNAAQNLIDKFFKTLTAREPFYRKDFYVKKIWGTGFSEKTEALYVELTERTEAATSSHSAPGDLSQYLYLYLWLRIIRRSDQGVSFMSFPSHVFLTILIMVTGQL